MDVMDEALGLLEDFGPEYGPGFSSHGPMAAEALLALGRGDAVVDWVTDYRRRLRGNPAPGLPVFAGGKAGFGVLLGPTGGYLIGFVVGAYVIGRMTAGKDRPGFWRLIAAMTVGHLFLYALGIVQLMVVAKLTLAKALAVGLLPIIPGGILKIVMAAMICLKVREHIKL